MWQPPRDTRGVWSGTRVCNWVLRVAHWALGERNVDTIGVGHVKIWGTEPGVPYVLPFVRGLGTTLVFPGSVPFALWSSQADTQNMGQRNLHTCQYHVHVGDTTL